MLFYGVSDFFPWIICYFYDFIKSFKVSLHLGYCIEMLPWCWNVYWHEDSWFCVVEMVYGVIALQEGYGITDHIQRIIGGEVLMWCYRPYHLIYCLCGTVGPWVKVLKPSRKTLRCGCMGLVLPLGFSP